jgi:small-conductance mechanosensitive channel
VAGILALGKVLAADEDAERRLLDFSDDEARRVRAPLVIVAVVTGAGFMLTRLNYVIGASVAATIAVNCALSLAYAAAAALFLVSFGRGRGRPTGAEPGETSGADARRDSVWTLLSLALSAAIVVTLGAVFAGFTTLAALTSGQIFWLGLVGAAAYLIMRFADDLMSTAFRPRGWAARTLFALFRFRRSTIAQIGALASAALQVVVLVGAVSLALTPFGQGGELLVAHLTELGRPLTIGSATISPGAVAAGIATFIIGMGLARMVQRWVVRRYLPVTDWDAGVRNSVTTGIGYLGVFLALACALAASGLGFTQIALIASALSVGIGFGLQTVVQNFVSGVILLVERPVKVGDWISIGGVEGGIRRIRVRATEIETQDRTTVIVPNSDFVTKPVANKTLGERYARVDIRLSVSSAADVERARDMIAGVVRAHKPPTAAPQPEIYIDSLAAGGAVNLACYFYVEEPRLAYKARSDCYFEILRVLRENKIAFAGPA